MKTRIAGGVLLALVLTAPHTALGEYLPSLEKDAAKLIADRLRFAREMYALDEAAVQKLLQEMSGLSGYQEKYAVESGKSLYRIEMAMNIVAQDETLNADQKQERLKRFQDQIVGIHARAPLSLAKVMEMIEKDLPKDKIDAARNRITAHFSSKLAGSGLNPAKIDGLLVEPIQPGRRPDMVTAISRNLTRNEPPPTGSQTQPSAPPMTPPTLAAPPTPSPENPKATPAAQPPTPPLTNIVPATPPAPPKEIPPAPPESEWSARMKQIAERYGFSSEQLKVAERALAQCMARATAYRSERKQDYADAASMRDGPPKESKLKDLNRMIDTLFDEMVQRVEALASIEQQMKVKKDKPAQ